MNGFERLHDYISCEECAAAFEEPMIQAAAFRGVCDMANGKITNSEFQWFLWNLIHMPVIWCPYCGDWEDVDESTQIAEHGRFWCCTMCELAGRGPAR